MKKIKVAEVITRLDWGGSPDIVRVLCSRLDPQVYDITLVIGATEHASLRTEEFLKSFRGKSVIIPELRRNINPVADLAAFLRLYFIFLRGKFDIVHTHTAKAGALGRFAAKCAGARVIVHTSHGHNFYGYFGAFASGIIILIERFLTGLTDKIITFTELEKKDFIRFKVAPENKFIVINQGLELSDYAHGGLDRPALRNALGAGDADFVVGMVSRLEPIKGVDYFVEALPAVARSFPRAKFVITGEGSLRWKLEKKVMDLGLEGKVIFTGWREDMSKVIPAFDILVQPSLNEAVGMVLIEAQASGVAVVAANVGGIPEVVRDNETGVLIPAKDSAHLAEAVIFLLSDEKMRMRLTKNAREWVNSKFDAAAMAQGVSSIYNSLIQYKSK